MDQRKLPDNVIAEVNEYRNILKADKLPISEMYVFGSFAKGTSRKGSDIDVCVVSPQFKDAWEAMTYLRRKLPFGLGWSIEPVGFTPEEFENKYSTLIHEIKKHGVRI